MLVDGRDGAQERGSSGRNAQRRTCMILRGVHLSVRFCVTTRTTHTILPHAWSSSSVSSSHGKQQMLSIPLMDCSRRDRIRTGVALRTSRPFSSTKTLAIAAAVGSPSYSVYSFVSSLILHSQKPINTCMITREARIAREVNLRPSSYRGNSSTTNTGRSCGTFGSSCQISQRRQIVSPSSPALYPLEAFMETARESASNKSPPNKRAKPSPITETSKTNKNPRWKKIDKGKSGSSCYFQVLGLGSDVADTVPSILLFCESRRYIFNIGEGFQRYCGEHKVKLGKLGPILLTRPTIEAFAGLPGLFLSSLESGVGDTQFVGRKSGFEVFGPSGINALVR